MRMAEVQKILGQPDAIQGSLGMFGYRWFARDGEIIVSVNAEGEVWAVGVVSLPWWKMLLRRFGW